MTGKFPKRWRRKSNNTRTKFRDCPKSSEVIKFNFKTTATLWTNASEIFKGWNGNSRKKRKRFLSFKKSMKDWNKKTIKSMNRNLTWSTLMLKSFPPPSSSKNLCSAVKKCSLKAKPKKRKTAS